MVQEDRRFFYLGMNQDSDPRYLKEGEYIEAKNFYVSSTDGGNDNALENVKSTLEVSYTLPSGGRYKCVKIQDDEENQRTYIFLWSSEGAHIILYYSYLDETLRLLVRDNFYSIVGTLGGTTPTYATSYTAGDVVLRTGGISSEAKYYICLVGFTSASYVGRKDPERNSLLWKEIGNYLNFQENNYIDSSIIIRDGQTLLFWTDNHNEPKYINVDKLIGSEYPTALQAEHFDLCPLQPLHQILLNGADFGTGNNSLFGKYFQFRYRWVFDDDMYGAWSPISEMNTYNTTTLAKPSQSYYRLRLRVYRNSSIPNRLKRIEVAYRECRNGNSGDWYKFADIDGSDISASNEYTFTKFDTTTSATVGNWGLTGGGVQYESFYEVIFDNNSAKVPLDQDEANQLYSFCPKKAGTLAITEDNRLVFGDIEENLDISGVVLNMTASYDYNAVGLSVPQDRYKKGLKAGATYKWGIRYSDDKGRLSSVLTDVDLEKPVNWFDVIGTTDNVTSLNMNIGHYPPSWAKTWQLCYLPVGIDYEAGTPLAYQFVAGTDTPANANGQALISLQSLRTFNTDNSDSQFPLDFSDDYYVRGVYDNSANAGAGATWAQYDESKVIETIDSGEIEEVAITAVGSGYTGNPTLKVIGGGGGGAEITSSIGSGALTTPNIAKKGSGYTSAPTIIVERKSGDVTGEGGRAVVSKMNYKKYIKIDYSSWTTPPAANDILEVYKKSTDEGSALWREFGYPCKIGLGGFGQLIHDGLDSLVSNLDPVAPSLNQSVYSPLVYQANDVGDMYVGRVYFVTDNVNYPPSKTIPSTGRTPVGAPLIEIPFADARTPSRSVSLKRPLVALEDNRLPALNTTLRWSDPLIQNTNINGLGFFYDINFRELKNEYGTIRKIFAENEYLKVLFDRKMGLLPMGRTEINSLDGNNFVGKTTDVFGTPRYSDTEYGISDNPESLSYFGGASMFVDRNKNTVLISSGLEVKPISDAGMRFFFDEVLIRSQRLINKPVIQSVYDKEFDTFILSINNKSTSTGTVVTTPPTTVVITLTEAQVTELDLSEDIVLKTFTAAPFVTETVSSGDWSKLGGGTTIQATVTSSGTYNPAVDVEVIQGQQYVLNYSPKNNKWMSFFDYKGDAFGSAGSRLCSSKDGKFYLHNSPNVSSYGNFYGAQHESYITIPFAVEPTNTKNARALEIESTDTNFYLDSGTNERGQSTSLINGDFEEKEGRQWANILMDENTPLVGGITNPITQGDLMIGTYFIAKINNTATSLVKVFSSTLRYIKSFI